jgi:hypothetical protein
MSQELFGQIPTPKYAEAFFGGQDEALSRLRRIHLRGSENVPKRYLVHVLAYNLSVLMGAVCGFGTPRSTGDLKTLLSLLILCAFTMAAFRCLLHDEEWVIVERICV